MVGTGIYAEPEHVVRSMVGCIYCGAKVGEGCAENRRCTDRIVHPCPMHMSRWQQYANLRGYQPPFAVEPAKSVWRRLRGRKPRTVT